MSRCPGGDGQVSSIGNLCRCPEDIGDYYLSDIGSGTVYHTLSLSNLSDIGSILYCTASNGAEIVLCVCTKLTSLCHCWLVGTWDSYFETCMTLSI